VQTVSAWERGHRPQRRFFGKIAEFLNLRDEQSVEALLSGKSIKAGAPIAPSENPPSEPTQLQALVIEAVANQLKRPGERRPEVMEMLARLMDSVGLPSAKVAACSADCACVARLRKVSRHLERSVRDTRRPPYT
jgi:hypothetical protein